MTSLVNSIKHFKKFYKIIEEEGPLTKSFYEATITLILKSKTLQGKQEKTKAATPISPMNIYGKILNKILEN